MNTIYLSRTELEEIILNSLNSSAQSRALVGENIDKSEFYNVANDIIESIIESQEDYDEDDDEEYYEDDDEFDLNIFEEDDDEYDFDDDDEDMEDDFEELDDDELF
ncbi:MAG: hypothetical protein GX361_00465 [Bacteroidales bacterium]|nr:hypothetical protein [Bacteroidales bacterium]